MSTEHNVLQDTERPKHRGVLKRSTDTELDDTMARRIENGYSIIENRAFVARGQSTNTIEDCRLPSAIGADQAADLTFFDLECHALKRSDAAELNMDVLERENCVTHALSRLS
jgi:hypothetical protein